MWKTPAYFSDSFFEADGDRVNQMISTRAYDEMAWLGVERHHLMQDLLHSGVITTLYLSITFI